MIQDLKDENEDGIPLADDDKDDLDRDEDLNDWHINNSLFS